MEFDPGVFGLFDLAALVQPHLEFYVCFVCLTFTVFLCSSLQPSPCHGLLVELALSHTSS